MVPETLLSKLSSSWAFFMVRVIEHESEQYS
jgi:hypothetical protein